MNKPRKPELEDSELPKIPPIADTLTKQLDEMGVAMNKALREATRPTITGRKKYRLLIVDDNTNFLESIDQAAKKFNKNQGIEIEIETLAPSTKEQVREYLLKKFKSGSIFDCLLLDFSYGTDSFNGLDILQTLRIGTESQSLAELDSEHIRLYYLPTAIVTRGGSVLQNDPYFEEKALGAGADKVYTEKGLGLAETAKQNVTLSTTFLLESLLIKGGFKEMRFRAWARLWQDLRDQMELHIKEHLDSNKWLKNKEIENALKQVWKSLADPIKKAGYATDLSMRILYSLKQLKADPGLDSKGKLRWVLRKLGSRDQDDQPDDIPWDAIPLLKACLIEEDHIIHAVENLSEKDLVNPIYKNKPEISCFSKYIGKHAMVARIDTKISPVGTFFITRNKDFPPFFNEDKVHLRIIVERLGLFYRELRLRQRNHHRQLALARLGRELLEIDDENRIVAKSVKLLHMHLHHSRSVFTEDPAQNPARIGRVSVRLIEPGTSRLMRPHNPAWTRDSLHRPRWALGFDTERVPRKITLNLEDSDIHYDALINKKLPLFFSDPKPDEIEPRRKQLTHAKMLAPIMAGTVIVGSVNIEHQRISFYGRNENASADFALLQSVASEVGHALRALRARRMLRKLLQLHTSAGKEGQDIIIANLMDILYDYTGCAVGIWMEPRAGDWQIDAVWECSQGYDKPSSETNIFNTNYLKQTWRLEQWRSHILSNFDNMLVGRYINEQLPNWDKELVFYEHENTFSDEKTMGIKTLSKALLTLRDPDTDELLGVFILSFNQNPGLDIDRQKPLLEDAARFAASYLSIRKKNRQFLMNEPIMAQQAVLGFAYQQLRHSLKLQLGGLNGVLDRLKMELEDGSLNRDDIETKITSIKGFLSFISKEIDMSKALMNEPHLVELNLQLVWKKVCKKFSTAAQDANIEILLLPDAVWALADEEIVKMVFSNLIDNAIEALSGYDKLRRIECLLLSSSNEKDSVRVAVRDSGPGIPSDIAERLFNEIGVSSKPSGSGFGTYFSSFMLDRSCANIEYDFSWQKGTQFILTFQAAS